MIPNASPVEDYCSGADETFVSHSTRVHYSTVCYSDAVPDYGGILGGAVDYDIVLDAAVGSDPDVAIVSANDGSGPYARSGSDDNVSDYRRGGCEDGSGVYSRPFEA